MNRVASKYNPSPQTSQNELFDISLSAPSQNRPPYIRAYFGQAWQVLLEFEIARYIWSARHLRCRMNKMAA